MKCKKIEALVIASVLALTTTFVACTNNNQTGESHDKELSTNVNGVVTAESWKDIHPEIYASYMENRDNDIMISHVEEYPMIAKVYEGMAFNKYYNTARGHSYTLEDAKNTGRPHALANCLTCKSADYTAIVNKDGVDAYKYDFDETLDRLEENVSCFNCHGNDVETLEVTHTYLKDAVGEDFETVQIETLTCGQCHVEYYFDPETKEAVLPYKSIADMHPDKILAYFNERDFSDYENPRTKTKQIKVQHPELETFLSEGSVHSNSMSCADCHMAKETTADGKKFTSHKWTSPLENEELIANNCASCHTDLKAEVTAIQHKAEERTIAIGYLLEELTDKLATVVESGNYTDDQLSAIRTLNREAQFYWDFVFVENSEGAHNSKLTHQCLDKAEKMAKEAISAIEKL